MPPKRSAPTSASTTVAKKAKAAPAKKVAPAESEVKASTTGRVTRGSTRKTAEELMEAPKEAVVEEKQAENVEEAPKPKKAKDKAATVKESPVKPATPAKAEKPASKKAAAPKEEKAKPASKKAEPKEKEEKKEKPASKAKGKKKEPTPEPAPAADEAMDEDNESFIGAFSDADDGADSSDDESDAEDAAVKAAGTKVEVSTLPHARDDKTVAARLKKASKKKDVERATLYLGRIPHGFYEEQMKEYFGQFGDVTRLRLARNPKTGASRHYAYLEFSSEPVAEIVADTMHNYLLMGHLLQCQLIPKDEVHPELWVGANKKFRKVPRARLEKVRNDKARTKEQQAKADAKVLKRQDERRSKIKAAGIDYDFEGH